MEAQTRPEFDARIRELETSQQRDRAAAAGDLWQYGPVAVPHLKKALNDREVVVQRKALESLGKLGNEEALLILIDSAMKAEGEIAQMKENNEPLTLILLNKMKLQDTARKAFIRSQNERKMELLTQRYNEAENNVERSMIEKWVKNLGGKNGRD